MDRSQNKKSIKERAKMKKEKFEIGEGSVTVNYSKNSSKLKIIKQDETGAKRLTGVEFQIWNDKNELAYTNLKTEFKYHQDICMDYSRCTD